VVADELFWRLRLAMSQCRHSRWRVLCVSPVTDQWVISGEERSKHDMLFVQQNPVGGYLSGMIAVFTCFTDNLIVIIIDVFYFLCYLPTSQSLVSPVSTVSIEFVSLSAVLCWALISHSVFPTWCYAVAAYAIVWCQSVTFTDFVEMSKHILKTFSLSGSQTILVFPYQTSWQYFDGNPPNEGVKCKWGNQKLRFWANIWLRYVLWTPSAMHSAATDHG